MLPIVLVTQDNESWSGDENKGGGLEGNQIFFKNITALDKVHSSYQARGNDDSWLFV